MTTPDEVRALLAQAEALPYAQQARPLEEAVRLADQTQDGPVMVESRVALAQALQLGGHPREFFAVFAWLEDRFENHREDFSDWMRHNLLWDYKWAASSMANYPQVGLDQLQQALARMDTRYRSEGEGDQPVLLARYQQLLRTHGAEAAEDAFEAWQRAERTVLSDCHACEISTATNQHLAMGRFERAIEVARPVLQNQLTCNEEPMTIQSIVALCLLELGRPDEAALLQRASWRAARTHHPMGELAGEHLWMMARCGHLDRGLEMLQDCLDDLEDAQVPQQGVGLRSGAVRLLDELVAAGRGDEKVSGGRPETVQSYRDHLLELLARDTAALDARNGNDHVSRKVASWRTARPLPPMPIEEPRPAQNPLSRLAPWPWAETLSELSPAELLALSEKVYIEHGVSAARLVAEHWLARRAEAVAETTTDPLVVARLDHLVTWTVPTTVEKARERNEAVVRALEEAGDPAEALQARQRQAFEDGDEKLVSELGEQILSTGTPEQQVRALRRMVARGGDQEALIGRARELMARTDLASASTELKLGLVPLLLQTEAVSPEHALAIADEAAGVLGTSEAPAAWGAVWQARVQAHLQQADGADAADQAAGQALSVAEQSGCAVLLATALSMQRAARWHRSSEEQKVEALLAEVECWKATGLQDPITRSTTVLAHVLQEQGRPLDTLLVVEPALAEDQVVAQGWRDDVTIHIGRGHLAKAAAWACGELGEDDRSREFMERAVAEFSTAGDDLDHMDALMVLGDLVASSDPAAAVEHYTVAAQKARAISQPISALVCGQRMAWPVARADGAAAALEHIERVHEEARAVASATHEAPGLQEFVDQWNFEATHCELDDAAARILAQSNRLDEALVRMDGLEDRWTALEDPVRAAVTRIFRAQVLLSTKDRARCQEALGILSGVVDEALANQWRELALEAAGIGATWLDENERPDEAQAFWMRAQSK